MEPRPLTFALAILAMALTSTELPAQEKAPAPPPKPLFDRLGGLYNISAVVDDFIDRLYVDDTLNANPAIKSARSQLRKPGLKFQVPTAEQNDAAGGFGGSPRRPEPDGASPCRRRSIRSARPCPWS